MPEVPDLYRLLGEAERLSGRIIEQPWFLMDTFQTFSLTVEFEPSQKSPIWTLCEALDDNYRLIWTCRDTDLYLLHDILSMFMSQSQPRAPGERQANRAKSKEAQSQTAEPQFSLKEKLESLPCENSEPAVPSEVSDAAEGSDKESTADSNSKEGWEGDDSANLTQDAQAQPPPYDSAEAPATASVEQPVLAQEYADEVDKNDWVEPATQLQESATQPHELDGKPVVDTAAAEMHGDGSVVAAASKADQQNDTAAGKPSYFDNIGASELKELKEKPNLLLGHLLVASGAIPEGLLDAALKLQEMVRTESLTPNQSIDAMRRAYHRTAADEKTVHTGDASDSSEGKLVSELLYEAGIVSRQDIEAATKLKVKRGGELEILRSSGKVDKLLQESAFSCLKLMLGGRIRHEQAIIALNYCYRSRVELREAFIDLGWNYPYSYH
jgi:hypothetical protein